MALPTGPSDLTRPQHPALKRALGMVGLLSLLLLVLLVISPAIGTVDITIIEAWRAVFRGADDPAVNMIVVKLRLPRTLLAMFGGATLAMCGAVFQGWFRNPLATPYTLGIASSGSLGALLAVKFSLDVSLWGLSTVTLAAFAAASVAVLVVLAWSRVSQSRSGAELLLVGISIGMFCSALTMFTTFLADDRDTLQILRWTMGSLATLGPTKPLSLLIVLVPCWLVLLGQSRALNQFALGEELAISRGISIIRLETLCIGFGSLAIAAVVGVCGPIGFVDLIVPYAVRRVLGHDHRFVLPCSALLGACFLTLCDWLSQLLPGWYGALVGRQITAATLPIGVITALIGAPIFLIMLRAYRRYES